MVKALVVWTLSLSLSHPFVALIAVECSIANPFFPKENLRKASLDQCVRAGFGVVVGPYLIN